MTDLTARCMKCKKQVVVSNFPDGERAFVESKGKRYFLKGACPECGTKVSRILSASSNIVKEFEKAMASTKSRKIVAEVVNTGEVVESPKKEKEKVATKKRTKKAATPKKTKPAEKKIRKSTAKSVELDLKFPVKLYVEYRPKGSDKPKKMTATMKAPDVVLFKGKTYNSLSAAAVAATGGPRVNGWLFWKAKDDNGELVPVGNFRPESAISRVGERTEKAEKKESAPPKGLPGYDKSQKTIKLDNEKLPKRNGPEVYAAYFIHPRYARWNHFLAYLWVKSSKELIRLRYDKNQEAKAKSLKQMGEFKNWKEAQAAIGADAHKNGFPRVKVR